MALAASASSGGGSAVSTVCVRHHFPWPDPLFESTAVWLNPRLTFDAYVVGSSNQLAHAAAHAVATMPSEATIRYLSMAAWASVKLI